VPKLSTKNSTAMATPVLILSAENKPGSAAGKYTLVIMVIVPAPSDFTDNMSSGLTARTLSRTRRTTWKNSINDMRNILLTSPRPKKSNTKGRNTILGIGYVKYMTGADIE
jgi:hypothetical protein